MNIKSLVSFTFLSLVMSLTNSSIAQELQITSKEVEQKIVENRKNGKADFHNLSVKYTAIIGGVDFDPIKENAVVTQINDLPDFSHSSIMRSGKYHQLIVNTNGNVTPEEFKKIISDQQVEVIDFSYLVSL